jgi:hypothetical protein
MLQFSRIFSEDLASLRTRMLFLPVEISRKSTVVSLSHGKIGPSQTEVLTTVKVPFYGKMGKSRIIKN